MNDINNILKRENLSETEIAALLSLNSEEDIKALFERAYSVKTDRVGRTVYYRGIIEMSNICSKDCLYCGIRRSNSNVNRYSMTREEIIDAAVFAYRSDYGSIVLQSGEIKIPEFTEYIEGLITEIKSKTDSQLGITLSLGEQSSKTYRRWFEAGAHRYLLRIETSSRDLYGKLHPADHSYDERVKCLYKLQEAGYQTGTGVMIGLPGQTVEHLASDIAFFRDIDIDMAGMGPFIPHEDTPLKDYDIDKEKQLTLALKMIAVLRIVMQDINIAATTALQALDPFGREKGIMAGANVIMPNITDRKYRDNYKLYNDKPCTDEDSDACRDCLEHRIEGLGETIGYGRWGDSKHYFNRIKR
ncbi:MAG: [FeFe] hydrogenase H-cluster radical SAM maturase HydE [candidate division WOR-3 bacterium]|nr:[FeFe] hydrogenase H-cluster radical SAM maturase HydE [candidate division WOR-3 bacterium]